MLLQPSVQKVIERPGRRPWTVRPWALLAWLIVSVGLHALLLITYAILGDGSSWRGPGLRHGPGGEAVEVSLAGPVDDVHRRGAAQDLSAEQHAAPEPEPAPPEPEVQPDPNAIVVRRPRPRRRERTDPEGRAQETTARQDVVAQTQQAEQQATGTGAPQTTGGGDDGGHARDIILGATGALGSQAAANALGAGDGRCGDPVIGTWRTQKYRSTDRTWVRFTLHVRREGDRLAGTIESRIWSGSPLTPVPGACTPFGHDHTWVMQADGRVDGESMRFGARSLRLVREDCPSSGTRYAPDHFRGTIQGEAFDALNNDGAYDVDEPYLFRRIACE